MSLGDVTSHLRSLAEVIFTQKWNLLIHVVEVLKSIAQCVESGLRVVGLLELGELLRLDTLSVGIGGSLIVVEGDSIEEGNSCGSRTMPRQVQIMTNHL